MLPTHEDPANRPEVTIIPKVKASGFVLLSITISMNTSVACICSSPDLIKPFHLVLRHDFLELRHVGRTLLPYHCGLNSFRRPSFCVSPTIQLLEVSVLRVIHNGRIRGGDLLLHGPGLRQDLQLQVQPKAAHRNRPSECNSL